MNNRVKILLGLLGVGLLFAAYYGLYAASISVTSEPSGAIVRVDGRVRGQTPLAALSLPQGKHYIEVDHTYFAGVAESIDLSGGDHLERHIKFATGAGTFEFLSNPKGAWVEVDGQRLAQATPTSWTGSSGPHEIRMGQTERKTIEKTEVLNAGGVLEVNYTLNIDPHGSVRFALRPADANVEFVGQDIQYAPNMRLPLGQYAVNVSRSGYEDQSFRFDVIYGDNTREVRLKRSFGALNVVTDPAHAQVRVSYREGGRQYQKPYSKALEVPLGAVEIQASALGYRTAFKRVTLGGDGATVRFKLEAMSVQPGRVFQDPMADGGLAPAMVVIPAGSFQMGNPAGPPSEHPVRTVTLNQPFAVSKYEITVGDYLAYTRATDKSLNERVDPEQTDHPVIYVSVKDASAYARWLSAQTGHQYRLLSEAEWEYVARAGASSVYYFGDDPEQLCAHANVADQSTRKVYRDWQTLKCDDKLVRPGPVGTYQANPFGLHDIYGNVAEWVLDCGMPEYSSAPSDGSVASAPGPCASHGFRGGSWDSSAIEASSAYRNTASNANDDRGIRLLRAL